MFIHVVIPIFPKKFWTARPLEQLLVHFVELCCHTGQPEFDVDAISQRGFCYLRIQTRNDKLGLH